MNEEKRRVQIIIQARATSTRLPNKCFLDLGGKPVLDWVIDACLGTGFSVAVAIPDTPGNDALYEYILQKDVVPFRGPEDDVLRRFSVIAMRQYRPVVVRITADCPLLTSQEIVDVVGAFLDSGADYMDQDRPKGRSVEVFSLHLLRMANLRADRPYDREHVTPWIRRNAICLQYPNQQDDGINYELNTHADLLRLRDMVPRAQPSENPSSGAAPGAGLPAGVALATNPGIPR